MTSACNTEKYLFVILFDRAKHLKVSVILFKRIRTFFCPKSQAKVLFLKNEKNMIDFTIKVFHTQLLKQTQNPSKIRLSDCSSLVDVSEILKIISKCIFCWKA